MDITLNGQPLTSSKRLCVGMRNLLFPAVSFTSNDKGGYFGRKISPSKLRSYSFGFDFLLIGNSFSDLVDEREDFIGQVSDVIDQGTAQLIIVKDNGKSVYLDVKSVKVTGDIMPGQGALTPLLVEFEAEYPFLQSVTEYINEVTIFSGGGFAIPFTIPLNMSVGGASEKQISNAGNYAAFPLITFYGDITNPTLTNDTTGKSMSMTATLAASTDYIVIDTFLRTVTQYPSGNSVRADFAGDFFTFAKGINYLKLTSSSGTAGKVVTRHRDHFVGI